MLVGVLVLLEAALPPAYYQMQQSCLAVAMLRQLIMIRFC